MNLAAAPLPLSFDHLFAVAASAWPAEVTLERRPAANGGYTVDAAATDAGDAFIGAWNAVLMLNGVDALQEALHAQAAKRTRVRPASLAAEVRSRFERRLRYAVAHAPDLGWDAGDVALIERYFEANAGAA